MLDAFRQGSLNTIVATSIGEEGLDIPAVDLIIFFDVVVGPKTFMPVIMPFGPWFLSQVSFMPFVNRAYSVKYHVFHAMWDP